MEICVFGAGAVGGYLAARLASTQSYSVSVIARGAQLAAIRQHGIRLIDGEDDFAVNVAAAESSASALPPQDIIFVTLKGPSQPQIAAELGPLLKTDGFVVFVSNGIPWWWNHGIEGAQPGVLRVDPEGRLSREFDPDRAVGCVVYSANEVVAPGEILHTGNNRWILGEPDNSASPRLELVSKILRGAALNAEVVTDLRHHIAIKTIRNSVFNSICALTRLPAGEVARQPALLAMAQLMADEAVTILRAVGCPVPDVNAVDMLGISASAPPGPSVKPSMLQDVEAGRRLEHEPLLGQLQQFARDKEVAAPTINAVFELLTGLDASIRLNHRV